MYNLSSNTQRTAKDNLMDQANALVKNARIKGIKTRVRYLECFDHFAQYYADEWHGQKEEVSTVAGGDIRLSAEFEAQGDPMTKTYLDGSAVKWSENDAIKVYDGAGLAATLTATAGGSTSASFTGEAPAGFGTPTCAIYPASAATGIDGTTISFTLPATQNYVANSFDNFQ